MKIFDIVRTANRNLGRSRLRTLLTISAIFVGAFTLSLTTALGTGAQHYLNRQLGNVSAPGMFFVAAKSDAGNPFSGTGEVQEYDPERQQSSGFSTLNQADIGKLAAVAGVDSVTPAYQTSADYITAGPDSKKFVLPGITQGVGLTFDLAAGRQISQDKGAQAVLPEQLLEPLGFSTAQEAVGKRVTIGYKTMREQPREITLTVAGVLKKSLLTEGELVVDGQSARTIAQDQGQAQQFFAAYVHFTDESEARAADQKKLLEAAGSYMAVSLKEQIASVNSVIGAITTGLNVVGIIALVAASFGIINTLLMSVYERTQEIGLMKALGTHRRTVFALFAVEAALVGFWGSLVAVAGAYAASLGVNQWASNGFLKNFEGFDLLVVTIPNAALVVGAIMLVAFLAGTLPAVKASRLNPIEALRSE